MSQRLDAIHKLINYFQKEYTTESFQIHPSLQFVNCDNGSKNNNGCGYGGGSGITAKVTTDIIEDEILLAIPYSARFSISNILSSSKDTMLIRNSNPPITLHQLLKQIEKKMSTIADADELKENKNMYVGPSMVPVWILIMYVISQNDNHSDNNDNNDFAFWSKQMNTWPTYEELCNSVPIFWDIDKMNILGSKNTLYIILTDFQREIKTIFENIIKPIFTKHDIMQYFISSLPHHHDVSVIDNNDDISSQLWKNFLYAAAIEFTRSHSDYYRIESPAILPLIDLFNGLPTSCKEKYINIKLMNTEGLRFITATRSIKKGEFLYIDYGDFDGPSGFLLKYGTVPYQLITNHDMSDYVNLFIPKDMLPSESDAPRIQVLGQLNYPTSEKNANKYLLPIGLEDYDKYKNYGVETDEVARLRQFIIFSKILDNEGIQLNLQTGRIKGQVNVLPLLSHLKRIIDYNIKNLQKEDTINVETRRKNHVLTRIETEVLKTSKDDMLLAQDPMTPRPNAAILLARICQREVLLKWRHAFHLNYGWPQIDIDECCAICGRTYPLHRCSRCKVATYCSREHQALDWKLHKRNCRSAY